MKKLFLMLSFFSLFGLLSLTGCHTPKPVAPAVPDEAEETDVLIEEPEKIEEPLQENEEEDLTIVRPGDLDEQVDFNNETYSDEEIIYVDEIPDDEDNAMIERSGQLLPVGTNVSMIVPSEQDGFYPNQASQSQELPTTDMIQRMNDGGALKLIDRPVGIQNIAPLTIMPHNYLNSGQPIQFGWGETSAVISGYIPAGGHVSYNLYAMISQHFLAVVTSDSGSAVLGISDDRGQVFVDPNQRLTSYDLYLPRTATYYVDIYSTGAPTNFTLQVFIPARVNIPQGQYSTSMSGNIGPYGVVSYTAYIYAGQTVQIDDYSGPRPNSFLRISGLQTGQVYLDYTQFSPSWYAIAPVTQDYLIEVITLEQPSNYRLTVYVK